MDDINKRILEMEEKYSIKFHIDLMPTTSWILEYEFAQEQDYENLLNYLDLFDKEFGKYPLSFLKKSKLEAIAIVKNLVLDAYSHDVPRAGIPDSKRELLIYDFIAGNYDKPYQILVVHHEFYHMLDEQFNGHVRWKDPVWNSFNINNDVYGIGGEFSRGAMASIINHPEKGFISSYSMSGLEEDKAGIFAALFAKEDYKKIRAWIKEDKILFKKIEYIKSFLKGIDRSFTDEYWAKIQD
ncbi:MAG: putative zinc-binding metallopeptidase [Proteobacteria bacterium]|nr:putative zinc-binding metallopeptidase [Pseudomonadota bacterium]